MGDAVVVGMLMLALGQPAARHEPGLLIAGPIAQGNASVGTDD